MRMAAIQLRQIAEHGPDIANELRRIAGELDKDADDLAGRPAHPEGPRVSPSCPEAESRGGARTPSRAATEKADCSSRARYCRWKTWRQTLRGSDALHLPSDRDADPGALSRPGACPPQVVHYRHPLPPSQRQSRGDGRRQ